MFKHSLIKKKEIMEVAGQTKHVLKTKKRKGLHAIKRGNIINIKQYQYEHAS